MKKYRMIIMTIALLCLSTLHYASTISHAKQNGFSKQSGNWYYYMKDRAVTGLKKIDGKYYYFGKDGKMKSGFQKIYGVLYYFDKNQDKPYAITHASIKYKGTLYYFSAKGKGFISQKNKKANKAVAKVFDQCKLKNSMSKKRRMEILYRNVLDCSSYLGVGKPELESKWVNQTAADMISRRKGNCYSYASLIGLLARAVGYEAEIYTGKCYRNTADAIEHSWVVVNEKYLLDGVFEDINYKKGGKLTYFFHTYEQLKNGIGYEYLPEKTAV